MCYLLFPILCKDEGGKQFKDMAQFNSVTSLDLSPSGDLILSGYERGQVVLWDTKTKSALKRFTISGLLSDSSSKVKSLPVYSIDNVSFLHDKMQFVVSCYSALFMVSVTKALFGYSSDTRLILSPKTQLEPIRHVNVLGSGLAPHPTNDFLLIAVATDSQVMIINLSSAPTFQILYRLIKPKEAGPNSVPYLAWRRVSPPLYVPLEDDDVQTSKMKGRNPHLAVGWGNIINLFQFYLYKEKRLLEMDRVSYMHVPDDVIGLCWLEDRVLAFIDSSFKLTISDPFVQQKVQSISVKDIEMVHHSRSMDIENTIDNQKVVTKVPLLSYHHSYEENAGMLYLLGTKQIVAVKVLSWEQRINALLATGSWKDTLQLALDFYQGRELAVIGLPTDTYYQQLLVGEVIRNMLVQYLDAQLLSVSSDSFPDKSSKEKFFEDVAHYCIEIALEIQADDLIFSKVFERFNECQQSELFFRVIEGLIISAKLRRVPEAFTTEIVNTYTKKQDFKHLEDCLINIDMTQYQNTTELLSKCLRNKMYRAYVYIMNSAKRDYITPLRVLLRTVFKLRKLEKRKTGGDDVSSDSKLTRTDISTSDQMKEMVFQYLSKLFNGEEYPNGQISHQILSSLKVKLLEVLFIDNQNLEARNSDDEIFLLNSTSNLPCLIRLLALDVHRFLDIISAELNDQTPTTPWTDAVAKECGISQRKVLEVLISVMICQQIDPFSPWEINKTANENLKCWMPHLDEVVSFLKLLLPYMARGIVPGDAELIHRLFSVLGFKGTIQDEEKELVQQQLIDVLNQMSEDTVLEVDKLLQICEKAQFYKVSVYLQNKYENYERILDSYLKDPVLRPQIFQYVHSTLTKLKDIINQQSKDPKKATNSYNTLRTAITNNLSLLLDLNDDETAHLIIYHFTEEYEQIIGALSDFPQLQYKFLRNIIGIGGSQSSVSDSMSQLLSQRGIRVGNDLHQRFLSLLCQHEPKSVLPYLKYHEGHYDIEYAVTSCQKYKVIDASAYLLERVGDVVSAVGLYLETLSDNMFVLKKRLAREAKVLDPSNNKYLNLEAFDFINHNPACANQAPLIDGKTVTELPEFLKVRKTLMKAIAVCDRNAVNETIEPERLKLIWYSLLDNFVQLQREQRIGYESSSTEVSRERAESRALSPVWGGGVEYEKPIITLKENVLLNNEISVEQNIREHEVMIQSAQDNIVALEKQIIKEFSQERLEQLQQKLSKLRMELGQLQDRLLRLRAEQTQVMNNPLAAHNIPKLANLWLQICIGSFIKLIYSSIITSSLFEWAEILEFTVNHYGDDHFGHFKESLTELFTNCTFEGTTYQSMKQLMDKDVYWMYRTFAKLYNRGVRPMCHRCYVCDGSLVTFRYNASDSIEDNELKLFDCGHVYHRNCLAMINNPHCPICNKHKGQRRTSGRIVSMSPSAFGDSVMAAQQQQQQQLSSQAAAAQSQQQQRMTRKQRMEYEEEMAMRKRHRLKRVEIVLTLNKPKLSLWNNMTTYDIESYQRNRRLEQIQQQDNLQRQSQQLEAMNQTTEDEEDLTPVVVYDNGNNDHDPDDQQSAQLGSSLFSGFRVVSSFLGTRNSSRQHQQQQKSKIIESKKRKENRKFAPATRIDMVSDFNDFF